ncbi:MAG TPA: response regulator [Steroidobacteraceae bacterium]|jgi:CheY-like chemotaxis protein|nr:response regulator [Steroidobacteraceae bacterium]
MSSKRALVVDDSKSARAFLSRILERHEITVDAADSAEAAIDYLTRTRPDVIFMDHMMPGMDGFQAVQTIKNNPRTAAIPILMYTSQEGDLYLGQARALGAEGVLPKQIKQSDVTKMLYQLQLVSDRRTREQNAFTSPDQAPDLAPANESAIVVEPTAAANSSDAEASAAADQQFALLLPKMSLEIRAALDATLQKEIAALRSFIGSRFDSHSERLQGDLSVLLPARSAPDLDLPTVMPERRAWGVMVGWSLALMAIAGVAVMSWLWWNQGGEVAALRTDLKAAYAELETLRALPKVVSPPPVLAEPAPLDPAVIDPNAVVPAPDALDAPDAGSAAIQGVELVPTGAATAPAGAPKPAPPHAVAPPATNPAPAASGVSAAPPANQTLPNQAQ